MAETIFIGQFLNLSKPVTIPFEPAPPLSVPATIPFEPPPTLTSPAPIAPLEPPPPLISPANIPFEPPPALSVPASIPFQPAPPLATPAVIPFEPPPALVSPRPIPFEPAPPPSSPAVLPVEPPPARTDPARLPPPPAFVPRSNAVLPPAPAVDTRDPGPTPTEQARLAAAGANLAGQYAEIDKVAARDPYRALPESLKPVQFLVPQTLNQVIADAEQVAQGILLTRQNKYNPDQPYSESPTSPLGLLVSDALSEPQTNTTRHLGRDPATGLLRYSYSPTPPSQVGRLAGSFLSLGVSLATRGVVPGIDTVVANSNDPRFTSKDISIRDSYPDGIVPARFDKDNKYGFTTDQSARSDYVTMKFTDLRPVGGMYRSVMVRPFITSLSEEYAPQWNEQNYFGRVDPVATYMSTGRHLTVGFRMVAFGPEDLKTIYQKLAWLSSMVYPSYDGFLVYKSGPVIALRIGNVINGIVGNTGGEAVRGLPGIITNLSYDYSDAIWEVEPTYQVPRNVNVSLAFTVLHDRPIGVGAEGKFGGLGSFKPDGTYVPPALNVQNPGSTGPNTDAPQVDRGMHSFRLLGPNSDIINGYDSFKTADDSKPGDKT